MAAKKPTPEEVEAARAIVTAADAEEADKRTAEAQARAEAREALVARLRELVASPAYQEVKLAAAALVPDFMGEPEAAHVAYLATQLHTVQTLAPPAA
jgi:hypothetical protein